MNTCKMNTRRPANGFFACAAAVALSIGLTAAAGANQVADDTRSLQVTLDDINLSSSEGRQIAAQRLQTAARTLCSRLVDLNDLSHHANYLKCVDSATATAGARLQAMIEKRSATPQLARADLK